jgi:hypothetical protein
MSVFNPAIIIIAYNRPDSILRLLNSVRLGSYHKNKIPLIISIDYQNSVNHDEVVKIAKDFEWQYGEKRIIEHKNNLGLKQHVISCGNLVVDYGSIIMLEDDIFVSTYFYNYATEALNFYQNSDEIGGISLYCHKKNFVANLPFELILDSNDVFFLQIASSWGQAWTQKQWGDFMDWMSHDDGNLQCLPPSVRLWPDSSWLKHFIRYLILKDKFFVYPNKSLSTNFGDGGTHNLNKNVEFQVPLFIGNEFKFTSIENSFNVYDAFFEILPSRLKLLMPQLNAIDFSVDLYGKKELINISTEYLLSSKKIKDKSKNVYSGFGLELKPMLMNVVYGISGETFKMSFKNNFIYEVTRFNINNYYVFNYFYIKTSFKKLLRLTFQRLLIRFNILI